MYHILNGVWTGRHGFRYLSSMSQCNTSICTSIDSLMCQMKSGWKEKGYHDHQHLARIKSRFSITDGQTKICSLRWDHRTDRKSQTILTALVDQVTDRERENTHTRWKNRSLVEMPQRVRQRTRLILFLISKHASIDINNTNMIFLRWSMMNSAPSWLLFYLTADQRSNEWVRTSMPLFSF